MYFVDGENEMETPDSIIAQLRAIKNLVESPSASSGEKENGKLLFDKLMKKYGLTEKDLLDEKTDIVKFDIANEFELKLLCQIVYKVTGEDNGYWDRNPHNRNGRRTTKSVWLELTKVDAKDVHLLYVHYRKSLQKGLRNFYSAFINANNIFHESSKQEEKRLSQEEMQELLEVIDLMKSIKPTAIPHEYPALCCINDRQ
jgi:hypothetical protein